MPVIALVMIHFAYKSKPSLQKDNTKKNKPQHLVTNIEYKLKTHRKRTKFLRAKIDYMFQYKPHINQCVQT